MPSEGDLEASNAGSLPAGSSIGGAGPHPSEEPDDPPELEPLELLEPLGFAGGFGDRPPGSPTPR